MNPGWIKLLGWDVDCLPNVFVFGLRPLPQWCPDGSLSLVWARTCTCRNTFLWQKVEHLCVLHLCSFLGPAASYSCHVRSHEHGWASHRCQLSNLQRHQKAQHFSSKFINYLVLQHPLSPPHTSGYPRPCHAGPWQGHGEAQGRPVPATEPAPRLRGARRRGRADPGLLPGTPGTAAGHAEAATDGAGEVGGGTAEKDGAEETTGGDRWNWGWLGGEALNIFELFRVNLIVCSFFFWWVEGIWEDYPIPLAGWNRFYQFRML